MQSENCLIQENETRLAKNLSKAVAFIFDFDGTIADTESIHYLSYNRVLEAFGCQIAYLEFQNYIGKEKAYVYEEIKRNHSIEFDNNKFSSLKNEAFLEISEKFRLRCFKYYSLIRKQYPTTPAYILSAQDIQLINELIERWNLKSSFRRIDTTNGTKTKRQFITEFLVNENYKEGDVVYFEDSDINLNMGKSLGLTTIGIKTKLNKAVEYAADFVVDVRTECFEVV